MTRKDLRVAESEWRATNHRTHAPSRKSKRTFGDVLNAIWRWIFA